MAIKAKNKKYWLGFDLGGTKMLAVVFGADFKPLARKRKRTRGQTGTESGINRVQEAIREALKTARVEPGQLAGIGIGCPGLINPDSGLVYEMTNLGWKNFKLKSILEKTFGCPVVIANDVDAGTYGEYAFGAGKGAHSVLGVFPGTGIGGGFVCNGALFNGTGISCMEIGHIRVQPEGLHCGCGQRGCLETIASRLSIASAAAAAAYRGEAPALLAKAGMDLSNIRSGTLAQAIREGDTAIEHIVISAAEALGKGIGSAINLLAPEVVVLGGGLVEAMPTLMLKHTRSAAANAVMKPFRHRFRIEPAMLGDDAGVKGAAAWAAHTLSNQP